MSNVVAKSMASLCGAVALMGAAASTASAVTVEANGVPLPSGTRVGATVAGGVVLAAAGGTATCGTSSLGGVVGPSGGVSVPVSSLSWPIGPAAGSTHCVNSGLPFLVRDATLMSSGTVSITPGTMTLSNVKWSVRITTGGLPLVCVVDAPSAVGSISNVDHSVTFTNVALTSVSSMLCSSWGPATLTAKFKPMQTVPGGNLVTVT